MVLPALAPPVRARCLLGYATPEPAAPVAMTAVAGPPCKLPCRRVCVVTGRFLEVLILSKVASSALVDAVVGTGKNCGRGEDGKSAGRRRMAGWKFLEVVAGQRGVVCAVVPV